MKSGAPNTRLELRIDAAANRLLAAVLAAFGPCVMRLQRCGREAQPITCMSSVKDRQSLGQAGRHPLKPVAQSLGQGARVMPSTNGPSAEGPFD